MTEGIKQQCKNHGDLTLAAVMAIWAGDKPAQIICAMESILRQTRVPDEFIIVMDGPVSEQILRSIAAYENKTGVMINALPKNVGRGASRNYAIGLANSDVIAIMDADDICRQDRFEKQLAYLEYSGLDLLGGAIEEFSQHPGDLGDVRHVPTDEATIKSMLRFRSAFNHVTLVYRRSLFQQIGGYRELNYVEDWDFYLRSFHAGARMGNLPDVVVDVRRAVWRRSSIPYFLEEIKVLRAAHNRGFMPKFTLFASVFFRLVKVLSPSIMLNGFYKIVLRQRK